MLPYRSVPSTESEESFRRVAGVQKALMLIQAPEPVVEFIQPAPQVQYAQPQYVQQAPAVEQVSVTHTCTAEQQEVKVWESLRPNDCRLKVAIETAAPAEQ